MCGLQVQPPVWMEYHRGRDGQRFSIAPQVHGRVCSPQLLAAEINSIRYTVEITGDLEVALRNGLLSKEDPERTRRIRNELIERSPAVLCMRHHNAGPMRGTLYERRVRRTPSGDVLSYERIKPGERPSAENTQGVAINFITAYHIALAYGKGERFLDVEGDKRRKATDHPPELLRFETTVRASSRQRQRFYGYRIEELLSL